MSSPEKLFNRQRAPQRPRKNLDELKRKAQRTICSTDNKKGTHTTLRCCVAGATGNPPKTDLLGHRRLSRAYLKALSWALSAYIDYLLTLYIKDLIPRRSLIPALAREN
jgi:hypothetical protein